MFISSNTSRLVQVFVVMGVSLLPVHTAAGPWQPSRAYAGTDKDNVAEWEGEVQTYEPGRLLAIRKAPQQEVKLDLTKLETTYRIAPGLVKGSKVSVSDRKLEDGRHEITVTPNNNK
ncbi:MAG: hypothetical protein M3Y72_23240 [Acidobacteriota bacterium]|nr:hypothetical protein [Acidobacteriota bacterium]